jgi:histidyl-tRNA synthetase
MVIGEDELAQGKVKIKEMGLREGHPEKEGVLVDLAQIVPEIKKRLERKADLDNLAQQADGLRVVGGIKGELEAAQFVEAAAAAAEDAKASKTMAATDGAKESESKSIAEEVKVTETKEISEESIPDPEKPADATLASQEAIGAVPAS